MKQTSKISSLALLAGVAALFANACSSGAETPVDPIVDSGTETAVPETSACATGELQCGGACVDPMKSHDHCGDCATTCGTAEACVDGKCSTSCPGTQQVCSGTCATVETDNANCGECGKACPSGQVCSKGACATSCASELNLCGGGDAGAPRCANTKTDNDNCGACDVKCPAGKSCSDGTCKTTCGTGLTTCGDTCANLASDNANCGACGTKCGAGLACIDSKCATSCAPTFDFCGDADAGTDSGIGKCVNFQTDNVNCGACGVTCSAGKVCSAGTCATTCASPLTTCGAGDAGTAYCANLTADKDNCGACGKVCGTGEACVGSACIALCSGGKSACFVSGALECVDQSSDVKNCGACGKVCDVGLACNSGTCGTPDLTVTATTNLSTVNGINRTCADGGDMVAYSVTALTSTTATLSASVSAGCLSAGDEVVLINLQGITGATGNVGNHELLIVDSVSGSTVTFKAAKTKLYGDSTDDSNVGTARTNQRVVLQRVPSYRNVDVASGATLTGSAWDGVKGGVFAIRASGTVKVDGTLSMKGTGYAGGAKVSAVNTGGIQGESLAGVGSTATTANGGGGGGGSGDSTTTTPCTTHGTAGGGGGYGASGGNAVHTCGGLGGTTYGSSDRLFLGSGGGSGGTDNVMTVHPPSGLGGAGGGIVQILAPSLTINGSVNASGNTGEGDLVGVECNSSSTTLCWDYSGPGGGGSGGTIAVSASNLTGVGNLVYTGGLGGNGYDSASRDGGKGSSGRLVSGLTLPASCKALLAATPTAIDGTYLLTDGTYPFAAYCDMTYDGGGWTLILDTNKLGANALTQTLPVLPNTGRAVPLLDMQRLATAATQVHIRTTGDTGRSATSTAESTPIVNLRAGVMLNNNSSTYNAAVWTGPFATDQYLKYTCARSENWPSAYQACGGSGLHIQAGYSRWLFSSANEALQLFVR
jgi:hypothetical protein